MPIPLFGSACGEEPLSKPLVVVKWRSALRKRSTHEGEGDHDGDVATIAPDTALTQAARMMRDLDTGFLPVGENDRLVGTLTDRDKRLVGIVSQGDLATRTGDDDLVGQTVEDISRKGR